jgi:hypothetical protein
MKRFLIVLLLSIAPASSVSAASLSCTNQQTQNFVRNIIRENPGKFTGGLFTMVMIQGQMGAQSQGTQRLLALLENSKRNSPLGPFEVIQRLVDEANISLGGIRLRERNPDTGMLVCMANARFQLPQFEYDTSLEIAYTVENSSDGEYVLVYGLN